MRSVRLVKIRNINFGLIFESEQRLLTVLGDSIWAGKLGFTVSPMLSSLLA